MVETDTVIIRTVTVSRTRSAREALNATGRTLYVNDVVMDEMPNSTENEVKVHFFNLGRYIHNINLEKEYKFLGLKPVDPYSLAAVNEADPVFANEKHNATVWKNTNGKWCFAVFNLNVTESSVFVNQSDGVWPPYWWFAGVAK